MKQIKYFIHTEIRTKTQAHIHTLIYIINTKVQIGVLCTGNYSLYVLVTRKINTASHPKKS